MTLLLFGASLTLIGMVHFHQMLNHLERRTQWSQNIFEVTLEFSKLLQLYEIIYPKLPTSLALKKFVSEGLPFQSFKILKK
jgi:hypothetical protein